MPIVVDSTAYQLPTLDTLRFPLPYLVSFRVWVDDEVFVIERLASPTVYAIILDKHHAYQGGYPRDLAVHVRPLRVPKGYNVLDRRFNTLRKALEYAVLQILAGEVEEKLARQGRLDRDTTKALLFGQMYAGNAKVGTLFNAPRNRKKP